MVRRVRETKGRHNATPSVVHGAVHMLLSETSRDIVHCATCSRAFCLKRDKDGMIVKSIAIARVPESEVASQTPPKPGSHQQDLDFKLPTLVRHNHLSMSLQSGSVVSHSGTIIDRCRRRLLFGYPGPDEENRGNSNDGCTGAHPVYDPPQDR